MKALKCPDMPVSFGNGCLSTRKHCFFSYSSGSSIIHYPSFKSYNNVTHGSNRRIIARKPATGSDN